MRISKEAMSLLETRAMAEQTEPSSFGRTLLYRALGIIKTDGGR